MAKATQAEKSSENETNVPANAALTAQTPTTAPLEVSEQAWPEGLVDLGLDLLFYNPILCAKAHIDGYILETKRMGHDSKNGPFDILVIQLCEPCTATAEAPLDENGDPLSEQKEVVQLEKGQKIAVIVTHKLQELMKYAMHPTEVQRFRLKPENQIKVAKGQRTMWRWKAAMYPTPPVKRNTVEAVRFSDVPANAQLPSAPNGGANLPS